MVLKYSDTYITQGLQDSDETSEKGAYNTT